MAAKLMSTRKKVSTIGPDHSGKPKRGFFAGNEAGLVPQHGPASTTNAKTPRTGNVARDGAAKRHLDVSVHNGMKAQQVATAGVGGMGHAVTDGGGQPTSNPLAKAPLPKTAGKAMAITPGHRNRAGSASVDPQKVLDECTKSGGRC